MSSQPLRVFGLTRPLMWFSVMLLRASPLLAAMVLSRYMDIPYGIWIAAFGLALLLQTMFFFVERRCSSPGLSYYRGLLVVAASVSTGWGYFDPFLVCAAVTAAQLLSCGFAVSKNAPERYLGLVRWFHRSRVQH